TQVDDLLTSETMTEGAYKSMLKTLGDTESAGMYKASAEYLGKDIDEKISALKKLEGFGNTEEKYLKGLLQKMGDGEKLTDTDVRLVAKLTYDPSTGTPVKGLETFNSVVENTQAIGKNMDEINLLSNNLLDDGVLPSLSLGGTALTGPQPISYTRAFVSAADSSRLSIPTFTTYARLMGAKGFASRAGQIAVQREGRLIMTSYGASYIVNNAIISPLDFANYKFYPCSDHALCMKSAVEPAIHIYPLEDCEAVGVNYIELEKTPEGKDLSDKFVSGINTMGDFVTGAKSTSKFYTASPCHGKMRIEKTFCDCSYAELPYVDFSASDVYQVKCFIEDVNGENKINCSLDLNRTYMGEYGEVEHIKRFYVSSANFEDEGDHNDVTFDMKSHILDTEGIDSLARDYYGDLYREYKAKYEANEGDEWEDWKEAFTCTDSVVNCAAGEEIICDPIALPAIPFHYSTCEGASSMWLKCEEWEKSGDAVLEKEGLEGNEKVPANEWCCLKWAITNSTDFGKTDKAATDLIRLQSCEEYNTIRTGDIRGYVDKRLKVALGITPIEEYIPEDIGSEETPAGEEAEAEPLRLQDLGILTSPEGKTDYYEKVQGNITLAILERSKITLPKKNENGDEIDPNFPSGTSGETLGMLYWYNLPSVDTTECLKISYIAEEGGKDTTKGFCYTSPTSWADVKYGGWMLAATAADIGIEAAMGIITGGGTMASGVGAFTSCMAGNLVMWYGMNAISKEKQDNYWPNNIYFPSYFT
ncbi:MAG: hypothetical protein ACP5E4_03370, partial [Candidatus Aenigmatarchaeota archaeon]